MVYIHENESDVNESKIGVVVVCPNCGKAERSDVIAESLAHMKHNPDGTYTDEVGCAGCEL